MTEAKFGVNQLPKENQLFFPCVLMVPWDYQNTALLCLLCQTKPGNRTVALTSVTLVYTTWHTLVPNELIFYPMSAQHLLLTWALSPCVIFCIIFAFSRLLGRGRNQCGSPSTLIAPCTSQVISVL